MLHNIDEKQKIFITGATSELLIKVISYINSEKYIVFCLSRNPNPLKFPNVNWLKGDIEHIDSFKEIILDCSVIIHAAAITHSIKKEPYFRINTDATRKLVNIAKERKIKFIFISSRAAGMQSGYYGVSKFLAEQYIQQNINNWLILRPSEIFGGNKNDGVVKLIEEVKTQSWLLCPVGMPSKMYPIFIDDAARIIYEYSFEKKINNVIVTINGKDGFTYKEFIKIIAKLRKKEIFVLPVPRFILFTFKTIMETFNLNIGIVPDQISRLYSEKTYEDLGYNLKSVEDYIIIQ